MIKAVLLDLDNTLLGNPDLAFATAFLKALNSFLHEKHQLTEAGNVFRAALHHALREDRVDQSIQMRLLAQLTNSELRPKVGWDNALQAFYAEVYPQLLGYSSPFAEAEETLTRLQKLRLAQVIATNPLYPETAVRERLRWAGLSDREFALITHSGNMHFSKPNSAYFAEILARVGVEPDEALMVGDSLDKDILPAQRIGLHTAWIIQDQKDAGSAEADWVGTLAEFCDLLATSEWSQPFVTKPLEPPMIEPQFYGNLGALFGLLENTEPHQWLMRPVEDEWSILQILCHMLDSEQTHQRPRLERILHEENPFIAAPRPPGPQLALCSNDAWQVAHDFALERQRTIAMIRTLAPEDWSRPARHSIFGPTTLLEMAQFTAQHDRLHLNQLCQTIGRCA